MANQIDNVLLSDDTTGLARAIDVGADALFLSTDLTLQAGGVFTADNIKRGTTDPNVALLAGNEGDLYQRTIASGGELWVNTDGTTTGWLRAVLDADGVLTWAEVLSNGNTSGGTDAEISSGDSIVGQDQAAATGGDIPITAGSATGGVNDGGDVIINPGSGFGGGDAGIVQVNGPKHYANSATDPTAPAPAEGDRYYNTTLEMEMRYDGSRSKWLSVETCIINASDQGTLNNGSYFQVGALRMSATRGYTAMFAGTVVSLGYTRSDSDAASFAVTDAGSTIASVASSAVSGQDTTLDGDFVQGAVIAMRNDGANALSNGIVWCRLKWRA
jgi:hypothetical protein